MDRLSCKDGADVSLSEFMGIVTLQVHKGGAVRVALNPDESEHLGNALITAAMHAREQLDETLPHDLCKETTWTHYWPFTTRCSLYLDEHKGRKCIDKHGVVWVSTAAESGD